MGAEPPEGECGGLLEIERGNQRPIVRSNTGRRRGAVATIIATQSWITPVTITVIPEKVRSLVSRLKVE
jgi:hypothetical protein